MKTSWYFVMSLLILIDFCYSQTVTTLAGSSFGLIDAVGTNARFQNPTGIAVDSNGNLYVAEWNGRKVRKVTPTGSVSIFAGSGTAGTNDGVGTNAQFGYLWSVAIDSSNNLYVADYTNNKIRKITPTGSVSTLAGSGTTGLIDGVGTNAQFNQPYGVAVDSSGNVYVGDFSNNKVRKITSSGTVTTFAGSGTAGTIDAIGTNAQFSSPLGLAVDSSGNVYVSDYGNNKIRKITPTGSVTTFAGSGSVGTTDAVGTNAQFSNPFGVAVDWSGNVYIADQYNRKIRKITPTGSVTTLAGSGTIGANDGVGTNAQFNNPYGLGVDSNGNIYVGDSDNNRVRLIAGVNPPPPNCLAGTFLSSGQCITCSPGTYSNGINSPSCTACSSGTFAANSGRTNCTLCPQGLFCPSAGLINATLCPVNKYCPQTGLTQPLDCPLNSTNTKTGSVSITDCLCNAGFYENGNICTGCPAGSYCPQNSSFPIACPSGYYCPSAMLNSPVICPQGSFCPSTGSISTTLCPLNKYCPQTGLTQPIDCPLNSTNPKTGSVSFVDCFCDAGFFKNGITCAGCPVGSYCPQNSSLPIICPVGYFCSYALLNSPTICPQGYYCDSTGLVAATQCGANSGTTSAGSISSANCICDQGYSSVGGICTLNQVTTTLIAVSSPAVSSSRNSAISLTIRSQFSESFVSFSNVQVETSTAGDTSSSKRNSGGGVNLAAALSNPAVIVIASVACLVVLAAMVNAIVAYRRIAKAKLRRKVGITTSLTTGGFSTNGRSKVTTAEA